MVSLAIGLGLLGIMFGYHWDENRIMDSARESFQTGNPLPGWYVYPSLPHDLATFVQFTKCLSFIYPGFEEPWKQHLMVRGVFIVYSCLGIVFTFLLTKLLTENNLVSLISAAFLAFSWELIYHSRWIAPDTIMMVNMVASVFYATQYYYAQNSKCIICGSIFGGLALASKYTAGLVFFPIWLASWFVDTKNYVTKNKKIKNLLFFSTITSLTFLVLTPGFALEFKKLSQDLFRHVEIYSSGYRVYTLPDYFLSHFKNLIEYFSLSVFSPNLYLSVFISLLLLPGVWMLKWQKAQVNIIWLSFPFTYFIFFCFQDVFLIRNYQCLLPFLATLAALGVFCFTKARLFKDLCLAAVTIVIVFNLYINFKYSLSIFMYSEKRNNKKLIENIKKNKNTQFFVTSEAAEEVDRSNITFPSNVVLSDTLPNNFKGKVIANSRTVPHWPAYQDNFIYEVIGPKEVNFNYYPEWASYRRFLVVTSENYKSLNHN